MSPGTARATAHDHDARNRGAPLGQRTRTERRQASANRARDGRRTGHAGEQPGRARSPRPETPPESTEDTTAHVAPDPSGLVVSHWFESGPAGGPPYAPQLRLTGRRRNVAGRPSIGDTFARAETVSGVVPGSGRVALTTWIYGVNAGEWDVTAELLGPQQARAATPDLHLPRAAWSWRHWLVQSAERAPIQTRWALLAPLASSPAVVPGSFTLLAVVAIVSAILSQPIFFAPLGVDAGAALVASALGLIAGLLGAKAWYMVLKGPSRQTLREGWSVDGFLAAAPATAVLLAAAQGLAIGAYLDGVAPGIFLAVAIGRVGCFLTGCCAGRSTAGWGIWSSDRRVGARRVPAQLLESAIGLALASLSALLVIGGPLGGIGLVFGITVAVYIVSRQGLLRLRAEARPFSWRRAMRRAPTDT